MNDLKLSGKKVKDLRHGDMVICVYKGISTVTFYSNEIADHLEDSPPYLEHLFKEEVTRGYLSVVGFSNGDIKLYEWFGINYLLLDYVDNPQLGRGWNCLRTTPIKPKPRLLREG